MMYLLEAATNPMLLNSGSHGGDDPGFAHPPIELSGDETVPGLLAQYGRFETPWKYEEVKSIVADAAAKGEKVLVWTNFVRNIQALRRYLSPTIRRSFTEAFPLSRRHPPTRSRATRNSTVFDSIRTARCSWPIQPRAAKASACIVGAIMPCISTAPSTPVTSSRARTGFIVWALAEGTVTTFTVLMSGGTIDDTVDARLIEKVKALSTLMDDPGLVRVALPQADEGEGGTPIFEDDVTAILAHLESPDARAP